MKAITRLQKTGYYLTTEDGGSYRDATGHTWFSKALARQLARQTGGMFYDGNHTTIKEVVHGYLPETLDEAREQLVAAGVTAESPAMLDGESERLAREERWS